MIHGFKAVSENGTALGVVFVRKIWMVGDEMMKFVKKRKRICERNKKKLNYKKRSMLCRNTY